MLRLSFCVASTLFVMVSAPLHAQGQVNVICSVPIPWCEALAAQFTKETGIKVGLTQKGSGESMAQVAAEKANPKYDVWYAGTGNPHLQAAELGLTEEYKSPMLAELYDWAARQAEQSKFRTDRCVIKGARNLDNAKKFYDWALTPAAQKKSAAPSGTSGRRRTRRREYPQEHSR